jgi:hypothetical protein
VPGTIDYALARRAVLREFQRGRVGRSEICDAHPELLRAARSIGTPLGATCPICAQGRLRLVQYVFGDGIREPQGRLVADARELAKVTGRLDEVTTYEVEVCVECGWNHLRRSFLAGRRHAG